MAKASRAGGHPGLRLAAIRRFHLFIGVFIAPSVLFFALTGAVQLFSLHEAHGAYMPPPLIEALSKVHKDQVFNAKKPGEGAPPSAHPDHRAGNHEEAGPRPTTLALKAFFLLVAAGLTTSTLLGLWMALVHGRDKAIAWVLLAGGAAIPIALLGF